MPNGGTDNCIFCPFNDKTMAATEAERRQRVGFCTLRSIPVNNGMGVNSCVNHPHHNQLGITIPIGPVFVSSYHMVWRYIAVKSPDSEEIRTLLLSLLQDIHEEPREEYGNGFAYMPDIVIWQLEQLSSTLSRQGVASVGEPGARVSGGDGLDRPMHRLHQRLVSARPQPAQDRLELGERLLDGGAVGRIRRQEEQFTAARGEGVADAGGLMHAQIVQHDHLPGPQLWRQLLADVPLEGLRRDRAFNQPGLL